MVLVQVAEDCVQIAKSCDWWLRKVCIPFPDSANTVFLGITKRRSQKTRSINLEPNINEFPSIEHYSIYYRSPMTDYCWPFTTFPKKITPVFCGSRTRRILSQTAFT